MKKWIFCFGIAFLASIQAVPLQKSIDITQFKNPFYDEDIKIDTNLKLQAIFNQKAKINGIWYQVNERLDNARLLEISNDSVLLQREQELFYLKLKRINHKVFID
ncbi:hypothetical protein [Campylobacter sp. MIT 97-5078]|uniref:hypothetical protein n=1 Tax=Campylobacter sp. MIT 97-5078 TaxID=1548153 RepID=UPI000692054C|nr:hypothetical protein [Campylobacter sp. MIT 97-5078]TQR25501.1 hypothetical protein DMB91_07470 [Campylobacter sp. MIT 97-5078]